MEQTQDSDYIKVAFADRDRCDKPLLATFVQTPEYWHWVVTVQTGGSWHFGPVQMIHYADISSQPVSVL